MAKVLCLLTWAGLTLAAPQRNWPGVDTTAVVDNIINQLDQPINNAIEAALRGLYSSRPVVTSFTGPSLSHHPSPSTLREHSPTIMTLMTAMKAQHLSLTPMKASTTVSPHLLEKAHHSPLILSQRTPAQHSALTLHQKTQVLSSALTLSRTAAVLMTALSPPPPSLTPLTRALWLVRSSVSSPHRLTQQFRLPWPV